MGGQDHTQELPEPWPGGLPPGFVRHHLGRFGEKVLTYLARPDSIGEVGGVPHYLVVDVIDLGDCFDHEEIGIDFHLSEKPSPPDHVPRWVGFSAARGGQALPGGVTRFSFTFSSELPFDDNLSEFAGFVTSEVRELVPHPGGLLGSVDLTGGPGPWAATDRRPGPEEDPTVFPFQVPRNFNPFFPIPQPASAFAAGLGWTVHVAAAGVATTSARVGKPLKGDDVL